VLQEKVKVPGLTEEMSLVGGNAIDHDGTLVQLIGLDQQLVIVLHTAQPKKAQAAGQPAGQQGVLVGG
jgi:hypothetical protein